MRLFVAAALNDAAREALRRAASEMRRNADGRYVPVEMYHVTLAFLGEVGEERLPAVRGAMDEVAHGAQPARLSLGRPGCFGRGENAILYCGVVGAEKLAPAADALRSALDARKLPYDPKPFKAHITLARRVDAASGVLDVAVPRAEFAAEGLTLYHSCRVDGVLRYLPIHLARFEGDDA